MKLSDPVRERIFAPSYDPPSDSSRSPTPNPANEGKGVEARQAGVGSPGPNTMAGKAARFSYGLAGLHAQSPLRSSTPPNGVSSRSSSLEKPANKAGNPQSRRQIPMPRSHPERVQADVPSSSYGGSAPGQSLNSPPPGRKTAYVGRAPRGPSRKWKKVSSDVPALKIENEFRRAADGRSLCETSKREGSGKDNKYWERFETTSSTGVPTWRHM